jgi:hypothetical protein
MVDIFKETLSAVLSGQKRPLRDPLTCCPAGEKAPSHDYRGLAVIGAVIAFSRKLGIVS